MVGFGALGRPDFQSRGPKILILNREVLHGVGADGVGVKFPIFAVNCCCLPLSFRRSREKRRKRGKMRRKRGKMRRKRGNGHFQNQIAAEKELQRQYFFQKCIFGDRLICN